ERTPRTAPTLFFSLSSSGGEGWGEEAGFSCAVRFLGKSPSLRPSPFSPRTSDFGLRTSPATSPSPRFTGRGVGVGGGGFAGPISKSASLKSFRTGLIFSNDNSPCTGPLSRPGIGDAARFGRGPNTSQPTLLNAPRSIPRAPEPFGARTVPARAATEC